MDLTEAEDIKKRGQEYTELCKKDLNDLDNHSGVIAQLESQVYSIFSKIGMQFYRKMQNHFYC